MAGRATVVAFIFAIAVWWQLAPSSPILGRDACDYAQIGRGLASGHGMATRQVLPRHVPWLHERGLLDAPRWPNLSRPPVQPVLNALAQMIVSDARWASVLVSGICFALSAALVAMLAARLGAWPAGAIAAAGYAVDPRILENAWSGLTEPTATVLLLLTLVLCLTGRPMRLLRAFTLGTVVSLAILTRTQMAYLAILAAVVVATDAEHRYRLRPLAAYALGLALVALPWMGRNLAVAGLPSFSFSTTRNLANHTRPLAADIDLQLHAPVDLRDVLSVHSSEILDKVFVQNIAGTVASIEHWAAMYDGLPWLVSLLVVVFLVLSRYRATNSWRRFSYLAIGVVALNFVATSVAFHDPRFYLTTRSPLYVMAGAAVSGLVDITARSAHSARLVRAGVAIVTVTLLAGRFLLGTSSEIDRPKQRYDDEITRTVAELAGPADLVASDVSCAVTLHTGRRSLRIPEDPSDLMEIDHRYLVVDLIVLSPRIAGSRAGRAPKDRYRRYRELISSASFRSRFEPVGERPGGGAVFRRRLGEENAP